MSQRKLEASQASQEIIVEMESAWVEKILGQIEMYRQHKPPTEPIIFKVPPVLRSSNPDAYEPKLVSIGPYHHGKPSLQAMEAIKWRLLDHLLSKAPERIHQYLKLMQDMEDEARNFYSEMIEMESHKFAEMLLLDGYFIIQLFIPYDLMAEELRDQLESWFRFSLFEDLVLVENQIPYIILERLLNVLYMPGLENFDLHNAILRRLNSSFPLYFEPHPLGDFIVLKEGFTVVHILHLFHKWILSVPREEESIPRENESDTPHSEQPRRPISFFIPSATDLEEAGVKIKKSKARNFLDISFNKGVLKIPAICVDDSTNLFFRNLIALEQSYPDVGTHITSYSLFMDSIINTESDVAVLGHRMIVDNGLGNNADVANVFNGLCKEIVIPRDHYLGGLCRKVNAFCNRRWHRWRARLMHDYFSNPWAIISVIAAAILLVLTLIQALLSILSYKQQLTAPSTNRL